MSVGLLGNIGDVVREMFHWVVIVTCKCYLAGGQGGALVAMDLLEGQRSSAYGNQLCVSCWCWVNAAPNRSIADDQYRKKVGT